MTHNIYKANSVSYYSRTPKYYPMFASSSYTTKNVKTYIRLRLYCFDVLLQIITDNCARVDYGVQKQCSNISVKRAWYSWRGFNTSAHLPSSGSHMFTQVPVLAIAVYRLQE